MLLKGMSWIVGDGQTIRIWKDPWLPYGSLSNYIKGPLLPHDEDSKVDSLQTTYSWSFDSLPSQLQNLIQGIPVARFAQLADTFLWPHNNVLVQLNLLQNFFFTNTMHPGINRGGTRFGH